ncbi:hypothetical protein [Aureliella helgolandensis]|uniref:hypothetical protein n=1 Tax=Aureliella helgolandensis TaxID=2527968 RepID=UPI00119D4773|nr:hypothetical protein [Aureliella helgolandensis]
MKENRDRFNTNVAGHEIHEPEQNAYGDWAAISIAGQYYLFFDFVPAERKSMSVGWFTSQSIDEPFKWCGNIGQGQPDPDIIFAESQFYLATQPQMDFVSPGPWVESVKTRVGVGADNDAKIEEWTEWQSAKEHYDYMPGFSKQVAKSPALLKLSELPEGYGFQFEIRIKATTGKESKPVLDTVTLAFQAVHEDWARIHRILQWTFLNWSFPRHLLFRLCWIVPSTRAARRLASMQFPDLYFLPLNGYS